MLFNHKISCKAFTLWEVLITLILTSLLVSLSYGTYHTFSVILQKDADESEALYDMLYLEKEIKAWTENCKWIELEDDYLVFEYGEWDQVLEFSDSVLILYNEKLDQEKQFPQYAWSVDFLNEQGLFVKSFQIHSVYGNQDFHFTFQKNYNKLFLYKNATP